MNINFNANSFNNELLKQIGTYVNGQAETDSKGAKKLTSRIEDGRVRLAEGGVSQTGKNGYFGRTEADKTLNNEMRSAFINALKSELSLKEVDDQLLDTLERLFGDKIFKKGDYNAGKPLTMRRITKVLNKFSEVKAALVEDRAKARSEEIAARYFPINNRLKKEVKTVMATLSNAAKSEEFTFKSFNATMNKKVRKAFLEVLGEKCDALCDDKASRLDLDLIAKEALQRNGMPADSGKVKAFRELLLSLVPDADAVKAQIASIAADADECIMLRAENPFGSFAMRYDRKESVDMIAQFKTLMPALDDRELGKYALIAFKFRADCDSLDLDSAGEFALKVRTLRDFGVGDEVAEKLFNVGDLNVGVPHPAGKIHYTIKDFNRLVDHSFGNALKVVFGKDFDTENYLQACVASFGKLPRHGEKVEAAYEAVKNAVKAMEDLGPSLMKRVSAQLGDVPTAKKVDAYLKTVEDAKAKVLQMARKGRFDIAKAVEAAKIPAAETLVEADEATQVKAMRKMMVRYIDEFIKRDGNANNRQGFNSNVRNMLAAVMNSFDKLEEMLGAKEDIRKAIAAATKASEGKPMKPCEKYSEGRELVKLIQDIMGAGAHGDTQGVTQIGSAAEVFFKIPGLFIRSLERDFESGTNEAIRELAAALNTDGCVQAYSRAILEFEAKLDQVVEYDLGSKTDDLAIIFGKAVGPAFPDFNEPNAEPITYDTFAHRLANFLEKNGYGAAADRYNELIDRKDEFMDYLDGRPVVA